ncbi:MAG: ROK family protein, partial [Chloroflexota bacterium]
NIQRLALERYGYEVSANEVISKASNGSDEVAVRIMQEIGTYIGQLIASLYAIFFPDKVVLTGGTATAGDGLLRACRSRFEELSGDFMRRVHQASPDQFQLLEIEIGTMKEDTGVVGSVAELLQSKSK